MITFLFTFSRSTFEYRFIVSDFALFKQNNYYAREIFIFRNGGHKELFPSAMKHVWAELKVLELNDEKSASKVEMLYWEQ